ncbi:hypothetical protein DICVIV_03843 [Dictyocaulus viviparus]|uniref:Mos1 transposase HTH domain-containing protein n=1 Tax=Dictyocaulus viviparus TaxID=29172 RepID=A0A0D8Y1K3_DICVI|nr:hypothetical protein DICVIV_03843 [Dictyocaulus viviparus]
MATNEVCLCHCTLNEFQQGTNETQACRNFLKMFDEVIAFLTTSEIAKRLNSTQLVKKGTYSKGELLLRMNEELSMLTCTTLWTAIDEKHLV